MNLSRSIVLLICFIALFISCVQSPLGRKQLILLPSSQMDSMGVSAFQEIKSKTPAATSSTDKYVSCVARALLTHSSPSWNLESDPNKWEVVTFNDDKTVNAFALPGRKIGVYTGLLKVAENQDQLAAVMGHEIGHVIAQHGNERVSESLLAQGGLTILNAALEEKGTKYQLLMAGLGLGYQFGVALPHSRTHESEADIIGIRMMAEAGFDPRQAPQLWVNMGKLGGSGTPEFMSTHPSHGTRISQLQDELTNVLPVYENAKAKGIQPKCSGT